VPERRLPEVRLLDGGAGGCSVRGAVEPRVADAEQLLALLEAGKARRATSATDVNAASSRSHAVCQICIHGIAASARAAGADDDDPVAAALRAGRELSPAEAAMAAHAAAGGGVGGVGVLTLVDCAGSERKEDSMYHDAQARKEGAEINSSLHALKECIRHRAMQRRNQRRGGKGHVHVPYRASNLTKVGGLVWYGAAACFCGSVWCAAMLLENVLSGVRGNLWFSLL
jgi:kinesin family protein 2/24